MGRTRNSKDTVCKNMRAFFALEEVKQNCTVYNGLIPNHEPKTTLIDCVCDKCFGKSNKSNKFDTDFNKNLICNKTNLCNIFKKPKMNNRPFDESFKENIRYKNNFMLQDLEVLNEENKNIDKYNTIIKLTDKENYNSEYVNGTKTSTFSYKMKNAHNYNSQTINLYLKKEFSNGKQKGENYTKNLSDFSLDFENIKKYNRKLSTHSYCEKTYPNLQIKNTTDTHVNFLNQKVCKNSGLRYIADTSLQLEDMNNIDKQLHIWYKTYNRNINYIDKKPNMSENLKPYAEMKSSKHYNQIESSSRKYNRNKDHNDEYNNLNNIRDKNDKYSYKLNRCEKNTFISSDSGKIKRVKINSMSPSFSYNDDYNKDASIQQDIPENFKKRTLNILKCDKTNYKMAQNNNLDNVLYQTLDHWNFPCSNKANQNTSETSEKMRNILNTNQRRTKLLEKKTNINNHIETEKDLYDSILQTDIVYLNIQLKILHAASRLSCGFLVINILHIVYIFDFVPIALISGLHYLKSFMKVLRKDIDEKKHFICLFVTCCLIGSKFFQDDYVTNEEIVKKTILSFNNILDTETNIINALKYNLFIKREDLIKICVELDLTLDAEEICVNELESLNIIASNSLFFEEMLKYR